MSGTVAEAANELASVYRLPITRIPRRKPLQRKPLGTTIFPDRQSLWAHVAGVVEEIVAGGQPVLVGVTSVKEAVRASEALAARAIAHRVLSAAQDREEAEAIAVAGERGAVTVATNMAGRGTDIHLGPGVAAAGGLVVLMCEMNDSRRADRQLIGRCGRQGDPAPSRSIFRRKIVCYLLPPRPGLFSRRFPACRRSPSGRARSASRRRSAMPAARWFGRTRI